MAQELAAILDRVLLFSFETDFRNPELETDCTSINTLKQSGAQGPVHPNAASYRPVDQVFQLLGEFARNS